MSVGSGVMVQYLEHLIKMLSKSCSSILEEEIEVVFKTAMTTKCGDDQS